MTTHYYQASDPKHTYCGHVAEYLEMIGRPVLHPASGVSCSCKRCQIVRESRLKRARKTLKRYK